MRQPQPAMPLAPPASAGTGRLCCRGSASVVRQEGARDARGSATPNASEGVCGERRRQQFQTPVPSFLQRILRPPGRQERAPFARRTPGNGCGKMAEGAPHPEAPPATGGHGGTHPDESQDTGRVPSRGDVAHRGSGARCLSPGSSSGTSAASCCLSRPARPPGRGCLSPRPGPLDPAPRRVPLRPGETTGPKTAQGHDGARADARGNVQAERRVCPGPAPTRGLGTPPTGAARSRDPLSQTPMGPSLSPPKPEATRCSLTVSLHTERTGGGGAGNYPSKSESGSGFGPRPRLLGFSSVPC